jgi:hypothetical protein
MQTARQTASRENAGESLHHTRKKWSDQLRPGNFCPGHSGCLKQGLASFPILQSDRLMGLANKSTAAVPRV